MLAIWSISGFWVWLSVGALSIHLTLGLVVLTQETVMNSRPAQSALVPGRIITTLNPTTHLSEVGVVIDQAQAGMHRPCIA